MSETELPENGKALTKEDEPEKGYLLLDTASHYTAYFFDEKCFGQVFDLPFEGPFVYWKEDNPHRSRLDSFLCEHMFMHVKSDWRTRTRLELLGTFFFDSDHFYQQTKKPQLFHPIQ